MAETQTSEVAPPLTNGPATSYSKDDATTNAPTNAPDSSAAGAKASETSTAKGHGESSKKAPEIGNDLETAAGESAPKGDKTGEKPAGEEHNKDSPGDKTEGKPAGGYDATPFPDMPAGYNIRITIHRAENLPMADMNSLSSDPYVESQLYTSNLTRHKEDPPIKMRTFTVRREINPEWNAQWILANVPGSGFKLKCRIYDEDPADHDDRLGNVHINVPRITEDWKGFKDKRFKVKKRMGSKRAYAVQAIAKTIGKREHMDGFLFVSIENLGRTTSKHGGRIYTAGPAFFIKHYSPLLGRAMGQKTPGSDDKAKDATTNSEPSKEEKPKAKSERFNFQANQLQLNGPVPAELYHRYVEFRPFVKRMFTGKGIRGFLMNKVLVHQHNQIYHYDRSTEYGYLDDKPTKETTLKFLDLVHYDTGGRIFTYIITLDALMRFTETGKEFGIQMLSKHSLHSAAETYIAFSGEFLIRRRQKSADGSGETGEHTGSTSKDDPPRDPSVYELVIDNDSGTYRPNADLLPQLKQFLEHTLPGLHVHVLDCQADADEQQRIKKEQLDKKKQQGQRMVYKRLSRGSSISSSDESDLDELVGREDGDGAQGDFIKTVKKDFKARSKQKGAHYKNVATGKRRDKKGRGEARTNGDAGPVEVKA